MVQSIAPQLYMATLRRPELMMRGIWGLELRREQGAEHLPLEVSHIHDHSPLRNTTIRAGQYLIAINGVHVQSLKQAVMLLHNKAYKYLTFVTSDKFPTTLCQKMVVVTDEVEGTTNQSFKSHPGINITSCRGRCLVQVSRVFASGPFATTDANNKSLQVGDIILSINGLAVAKPELADQILQLGKKSIITCILAIDIVKFRKAIADQIIESNPDLFGKVQFKIKPKQPKKLESPVASPNYTKHAWKYRVGVEDSREDHAKVYFNTETQYMCSADDGIYEDVDDNDTVPFLFLDESENANTREDVPDMEDVVPAFIEEYNRQMEITMLDLEDIVNGQAWNVLIARPPKTPEEEEEEEERSKRKKKKPMRRGANRNQSGDETRGEINNISSEHSSSHRESMETSQRARKAVTSWFDPKGSETWATF